MKTTPALVSLEGLTKHYQEGDQQRVVLADAWANIGSGELVVLYGRSGCGKSTCLNLISGIDRPSDGRVLIEGTDLAALSERQRTLFRRHRVGFIFQFFNLIPTLTVAENLLLPLELVAWPGDRRHRVQAHLAHVGLEGRAEAYPDRLSGGEQQRLATVRALIHEPALLLADEPTGNLDGATGQQVLGLLQDLVRDVGMSLILVTHSPDQIANADRYITLAEGRLTERAPA